MNSQNPVLEADESNAAAAALQPSPVVGLTPAAGSGGEDGAAVRKSRQVFGSLTFQRALGTRAPLTLPQGPNQRPSTATSVWRGPRSRFVQHRLHFNLTGQPYCAVR
jgi:hypothetical protein